MAVGVVFDVQNRLAVGLTTMSSSSYPNRSSFPYKASSCTSVNAEKCLDRETVFACGVDGRANTDAVLAGSCSADAYAVYSVNSYEPSGCISFFCKRTKWFIPSVRDLTNIRNSFDTINNTFALLSLKLELATYWSSTEADGKEMWTVSMSGSAPGYGTDYGYYKYHAVLPVVKF